MIVYDNAPTINEWLTNFKFLFQALYYRSSTFFMAKIFHVYLFRGILFSLFSISTKIFEHEIFFSSVNEEVYSKVYHSLHYYFSRLSSLLLSGRPVQARC